MYRERREGRPQTGKREDGWVKGDRDKARKQAPIQPHGLSTQGTEIKTEMHTEISAQTEIYDKKAYVSAETDKI